MTPQQEDTAILRAGWDDRTLADMLFMPVAMLRLRREVLMRQVLKVPQHRNGEEWTPSQDMYLIKAHDGGMSYSDIAQKMGCSPWSAKSRAIRVRLNKKIALNALSYAGKGSMEGETA